MRFSMKFKESLKFMMVLIFITAIASCEKSNVEDKNESKSQATFEFGDIKSTFSEAVAGDKAWPNIKNTFNMELESCFKDKYYRENIAGEKFEVESDLNTQVATSKVDGCIRWTESFEFDYLKDETYYEIGGTIKGLGDHPGSMEYTLAVNPWTEKVVFNSRNVEKLAKINNLHNKMATVGSHFKINEYDIRFTETNFFTDETVLKMNIETVPLLVRKNLNGVATKEVVTSGRFSAKYFLISKNKNNDEVKILDSYSDQRARVGSNGKILSEVQFSLRNGIDPNTEVGIGYSMTPKNGGNGLGIDSGYILLSKSTGKFSGKTSALIMPISEIYSLQSEQTKSFELKDENFGFIVQEIKISAGTSKGNNTGGGLKRIKAKFDINMIDSLVKKGIQRHSFLVDIVDKERGLTLISKPITTMDSNGHMKFEVTIPFNSTDQRKWREISVKISGLNSPYDEGLVRERIVYINPFLEGSSNFGLDGKFLSESPNAGNDYRQEIKIHNVYSHSQANDQESFKLNKNLDLIYTKKLVLEMDAKVLANHNVDGNFAKLPSLMNGEYNVRFLILTPKNIAKADFTKDIDLNDFYTLTGGESIGYVSDGNLDANIEFPLTFRDQIYYSLRNVALIEVTSTDEESDIKPGYFIGSFVGAFKKKSQIQNFTRTGKKLTSRNVNISKVLIKRLKHIKNKLKKDNSIDWYKNYTDFKQGIISQNIEVPVFSKTSYKVEKGSMETIVYDTEEKLIENYGSSISKSSLTSLILKPDHASKSQLEELCHVMFDRNDIIKSQFQMIPASQYAIPQIIDYEIKGHMYNYCITNPRAFLSIKKMGHVKEITGQPKFVAVEPHSYSRSNAYFMSKGNMLIDGKGTRDTRFTQRGFMAEFLPGKFHFMGGMSVGGGFRSDVYTLKQNSEILTKQVRNINQDGVKIGYDNFKVHFRAKLKSCILVTPRMAEVEMPVSFSLDPFYIGEKGFMNWMFGKKKNMKSFSASKRIYICAREIQNVDTHDNWYFLKITEKTAMADEELRKNSVVNVIRGEANLDVFREQQMTKDEDLILYGYDTVTDSVTNTYEEYMDKQGKVIDYKRQIGVGFSGLIELGRTRKDQPKQ